jgi:hypothetical protein
MYNMNFLATPCGKVLDTEIGYISHKYGMNFDPNERCVWTIQVPGASSYRFIIYGLEVTEVQDGISISTLQRVENPIRDTRVL